MNNYQQAVNLFDFSQQLRRDFHQHPELGFQEIRTAGIVAEKLNEFGYEVVSGIAKTGVVGILEGEVGQPVIMLRFDMDALPVTEKNETDYISQNSGVMHACGHDAHVSIGLTIARIIAENRADYPATIKLIFQPAEEGLGGAEAMIADGVLSNPAPDYILGAHVWNEQPLGLVGLTAGPFMAGADTFEVLIKGKGGHGGHPHETIDPIPAAAQFVLSAQTIISRIVPSLENAVLSICSINGGNTFNVVPGEVRLSGTIRTYKPEIRETVISQLTLMAEQIAAAFRCSGSFKILETIPSVINHPDVVAKIMEPVRENVPNINLVTDLKTMVSEDYAFYLHHVPGCFIFVGSANEEKNLNYPHHHPQFDIDEQVIPIAAAVLLEATKALCH